MKKSLLVFAFLLLPVQAYAVSTNFFIFFDETTTGIDWSGLYTITDGKLTAFSALIGTCADSWKCTWDHVDPATAIDPGIPSSSEGIILTHTGNDRLTYSNFGWASVTQQDPAFFRFGVYNVVATSEPSALWLILTGLALYGLRGALRYMK